VNRSCRGLGSVFGQGKGNLVHTRGTILEVIDESPLTVRYWSMLAATAIAVVVEFWLTGIVILEGYRISLQVRSRDYECLA
jgi:hypothetical protein